MSMGDAWADGVHEADTRASEGVFPLLESLEPRLLLDGALTDFQAVEPFASLVYETSIIDNMATPGEVDHFTVALQAGQTLMTVVEPDSPWLSVSLSILDPGSVALATSSAGGAGQAAWTQTVSAAVDGTYVIDVTSAAGTG